MIVIPMAGLSRRFSEAGYVLPKYMLEAHGRTVFDHAVSSFSRYFSSVPFLFIVRNDQDTPKFVRNRARELGISSVAIAVLDGPTGGQAETVSLGLQRAEVDGKAPLTIFNIDTFRPGFSFPINFNVDSVDGYLEVFEGHGDNWSYVRPLEPGSNRVVETAEKRRISHLCCTGLYHFRTADLFHSAYSTFVAQSAQEMGLSELFVAPIYNLLLKDGLDIRYSLISSDQVIFCGLPQEYEAFKTEGYPPSAPHVF